MLVHIFCPKTQLIEYQAFELKNKLKTLLFLHEIRPLRATLLQNTCHL